MHIYVVIWAVVLYCPHEIQIWRHSLYSYMVYLIYARGFKGIPSKTLYTFFIKTICDLCTSVPDLSAYYSPKPVSSSGSSSSSS